MTKYGLIGFPLTHSFSKRYFEQKFKEENIIDAVFENYELPEITAVEGMLKDPELKGFCITIPYKKAIIPYLDEMSRSVREMDACNCVQIEDGRLKGFNTDVLGFKNSFTPHLKAHHRDALILGTGGAAAAVQYVLRELGIQFKMVSRNPQEGQLSYQDLKRPEILRQYTVIINCSPVGTFPKESAAPDLDYTLLTPEHYLYDLVYNPPMTRFLQHGQDYGATIQNGLPMLEIQAEENWRLWNQS